LRLTKTQTHAAIHGISNVNTATHHSVAVHVKSRISDWYATLNCVIMPNITGVAPSAKLDISSWKLPRTSSWQMNNLMNQEASIYLLVLTYSTRFFDQDEEHVKAVFQSYKKQLLAGQSLVAPKLSHTSQSAHSCFEKTTVWSKI
jgi:hypothetical protein